MHPAGAGAKSLAVAGFHRYHFAEKNNTSIRYGCQQRFSGT